MANDLSRLASALRRTPFLERRSESRLWCSDLVQLWWKPEGRWKRKGLGVLEDISPSGACVQLEDPVPKGVAVRIKHPDWKVEGEVRYCLYRDHGYFVGVKLADNFKWSEAVFRPKHLLDPQSVISKKKKA
jgi:hypothetical protein